MAQAYTPALEVSQHTLVRKLRELPLPGSSLVKVGDRLQANTPVLETQLPGELDIVRVAQQLGFDPIDVLECLKVKVGDHVTEGQLICEVKSFFGLLSSKLQSPTTGEVEFFIDSNAHLGIRRPSIPLSVDAYIAGSVVEVDPEKSVTIESESALIQGIFGIGGEKQGEIFYLEDSANVVIEASDLKKHGSALAGKVLIGGLQFSRGALAEAERLGVSAVVCGSIDSKGLADFLGFELGVSITGDEEVPFTLIITEGFGELAISSRVCKLAKRFHGQAASVNGATQVRAGALRPEIIIPLNDTQLQASAAKKIAARSLDLGTRIRIIRHPYFGAFGEVTELPHEPVQIPSGAWVRVLRAKLETGEEALVPRANVELV